MDALDSNVYLLNLSTMTWEVDDSHNGLYREGHLAVYIGNGNIFVFGGIPFDDGLPLIDPNNTQRHRRNVLSVETPRLRNSSTDTRPTPAKIDLLMMIYNIVSRTWIGPPKFALNGAPSSRSRHACCLSGDKTKLYISGGLVQSTPLDDLFCYDLSSGVWQGPIQFVARFDHFITIHDDKLYSFGGLDKDMNIVKDTITWYSLSNGTIGELNILQKSNLKVQSPVITEIAPHDHERIYLNSNIDSAVNLTICLPLWSTSSNQFNISLIDLHKFEFKDLFDINDLTKYFKKNNSAQVDIRPFDILEYTWKQSFTTEDGDLYLLGCKKSNLAVEEDIEDEELQHVSTLSCVLQMKLNRFGLCTSNTASGDLAMSLRALLLDQQYTDFEILCNDHGHLDYAIKVHKAILVARWGHFKRMVGSGMSETITNCVEIPEPVNWVRGLVHFIYTGSVDFEDYLNYDLVDYVGLLTLSNMYELPMLRDLVIARLFVLFEEFQSSIIESDATTYNILVKLWKDLSFSREDIFIIKVITVIKRYWTSIIHSDSFLNLSKDEIVKLCHDCTSDDDRSDISKTQESTSSSLNHTREGSDVFELTRNSNSPFLIESPVNRPTSVDSNSFPNLQRLTGVLNDNL